MTHTHTHIHTHTHTLVLLCYESVICNIRSRVCNIHNVMTVATRLDLDLIIIINVPVRERARRACYSMRLYVNTYMYIHT